MLQKMVGHFLDAIEADVSGSGGKCFVNFAEELLCCHIDFIDLYYFSYIHVRFRIFVTELFKIDF